MRRGAWKIAFVVVAVAACALGAPAVAADGTPRTVSAANALERGVLSEINALRLRHGLEPLRVNLQLTRAADGHSRAMVDRGFFSHTSADGTSFWKRVQRHYAAGGRGYWSVGENLLWASPSVDPAGALRMWLDSPPHRKNLLTARWREIGLSAVHASAAPGAFKGLDVVVITANFGVRR